jgi:hypothetical protein
MAMLPSKVRWIVALLSLPLGIGKATDLSHKNSLDVFCEMDPFAFSFDKVRDFALGIGKATDLSRKSSLDIFCEMDPFALSLDKAIGFHLGTGKATDFSRKSSLDFSCEMDPFAFTAIDFSSGKGEDYCNHLWDKSVGISARFSGLIISIRWRKSAKSCLSG